MFCATDKPKQVPPNSVLGAYKYPNLILVLSIVIIMANVHVPFPKCKLKVMVEVTMTKNNYLRASTVSVGTLSLQEHLVWRCMQWLWNTSYRDSVTVLFSFHVPLLLGAVVAEWLNSWLAEQEDWGWIPGLATWIFRDWLSPAFKLQYSWNTAEAT